MKKITTKCLAEIAIMATLAFALDALQGGLFRGLFPNGGSIGFAMLPILIMCFRRGFLPGLLTALILSFLQLLGGVYVISNSWYMIILQLLLDYIVAYPLVAVAGIFYKTFQKSSSTKRKISILIAATCIGGFLKFLAHYLAGVIFWADNCPTDFLGGPLVYSLVYNGGYMLPNIIVNAIVLCILLVTLPQAFMVNVKKGENEDEKQTN